MADSHGPARGYSWPPFEPGHTKSIQHGANSERRIAPLAADIEKSARSSPAWPSFLDDPSYGPAVASWAWSEAVCRLLRDYLAELDVAAMLTERADEESNEERAKGRTRRRTTSQRQVSALEASRKWESIAAGRRRDLGLDPTSRAKLIRDDTTSRAIAAHAAVSELAERGRRIIAARTDLASELAAGDRVDTEEDS